MTANIKSTQTSELDQTIKIQTTASEDVDRAGGNKETTWQSTNWTIYNGYYKKHLSVKSVINKLGMWTVGKGYKGNEEILGKIKGWGKDTFNKIIDNLIRIKHINGDSYAEIIRDKSGKLINLKPLNPGEMIHVVNSQGMLKEYKQTLTDGTEKTYELDKIFHMSLNRTADEIHGTSDIEALITFLDKIKQLDEDMSVMFHRFVVPLVIWKLNTDDTTAMSSFKANSKVARNGGDDMVIPETAVSWDLLEAGKNGIDPMNWRNKWTEEVIKGGGVPALIMSIEAGTTEASAKMVYLAFQQVIEKEIRDTKDDIKLQLGLDVDFDFPARIEENLGEDEGKDGKINQGKRSEVSITTKRINERENGNGK